VKAVALDHGGVQVLALEDVFEGALDGGGAGARGTGHDDDGMLLGHVELPLACDKRIKKDDYSVRQYKRRSPSLSPPDGGPTAIIAASLKL
jgi:hypothetical protein